MSKIAIQGNASGTGTVTIAAPNTNTDRTLTLPDATGTLNTSGAVNEVPAGSASAPAIYPTGDSNTGIFFPAADTVAVATGGSESVRVDSSGNLGLGVTPSAWGSNWRVSQVGSTGGSVFNFTSNRTYGFTNNAYNDNTNWRYVSTGFSTLYVLGNDGSHAWSTAPSGTAGNSITFTERMRIDSSGYFYVNNMAVGGTANLHWSSSNGQFFVTSSSRRFKHDITDYDKGLAEVMQMQPKYFVYNEEPSQKQRVGFIAEDFHDLGMTEFVEYWKDENDQDTPSEIGYSNMVAILVKSIQELKAITDAQATRIEALEAEVAVLKGQA